MLLFPRGIVAPLLRDSDIFSTLLQRDKCTGDLREIQSAREGPKNESVQEMGQEGVFGPF